MRRRREAPPGGDLAAREYAEAEEHRRDEARHRTAASTERAEADIHRREGRSVAAAGDELQAKGHDFAARVHDLGAEHDEGRAARAAPPPLSDRPGAVPVPSPPALEGAAAGVGHASAAGPTALFADEQQHRFWSRWDQIQASFIDQPRQAVADADSLVREATDALHSLFDRDRRQLESVWDRGDDASTEDLRITLQRYRTFFERLLAI